MYIEREREIQGLEYTITVPGALRRHACSGRARRDFPLQGTSLQKGFPLKKGLLCRRDFPLEGISPYKGLPCIRDLPPRREKPPVAGSSSRPARSWPNIIIIIII